MSNPLTIVGISGSLREGSYNTALLRAATELAPEGMEITLHDIHDIPFYNADIDKDGGPPPVQRLKAAIDAADGLLLATPEYNYSVSGVLKNTIDWASRSASTSVLHHKEVAVLSASAGKMGGVRAQMHLRQILFGMQSRPYVHGEYLMAQAGNKFNDQGALTDDPSRKFLQSYLQDWHDWLRHVQERG